MDALVRVAEEQDAEAACQVLRKSITDCCVEDHRGDPEILNAWLANKTPANARVWIMSHGGHALVAEAGGAIVGFASILDSGEITLCYVLPEARFKGVGTALLTSLEVHSAGRGVKRLHLESTKTARSFYLRHGYKPNGEPQVSFGLEGFPMVKTLEG